MGYVAIACIAAVWAYFHYLYKAKDQTTVRWFLAFLRFVSVAIVLVLVWNPLWVREQTILEKQPLVLAIDNSKSMAYLKQDQAVLQAVSQLASNTDLQNRFEIDTLWLADSTRSAFSHLQTPLSDLAIRSKKRYGRKPHNVILLTDGNANQGEQPAYQFSEKATVYPIVFGDTTRFEDLAVAQVNANRYAYVGNQFPVEVLLQYKGTREVQAQLLIKRGGEIVHRETVQLGANQPAVWKEVLLTASQTGKLRFTAELTPLQQERNVLNNQRHFATEVIDQRAKVALVSAVIHPDLSALKQSLQVDGQREITLYKPTDVAEIAQADLQIWYQPTAAFDPLVAQVATKSLWIITGLSTDFAWLNAKKLGAQFKVGGASEYFKPQVDPSFSVFSVPELHYTSFAPLAHPFGQWTFEGPHQILLQNTIGPVTHQSPMLVVSTSQPRRVFWMGEGAWQWRLQQYAQTGESNAYAQWIGKLAQYATVNQNRERLVLTHEPTLYQGENAIITAQTFNANFEFVPDASLQLSIQGQSGAAKLYDLRLQGDVYTQVISQLAPGKYTLQLTDKKQGLKTSSTLEVIPFNLEQLATHADFSAMQEVATATEGQAFTANQIEQVVERLLNDQRHIPREKTRTLRDSLLDHWWLLLLLACTLAAEWFIRKYRGWL